MKVLVFVLWISFLSLPFVGLKNASYVFAGALSSSWLFMLLLMGIRKIRLPAVSFKRTHLIISSLSLALVLPVMVENYYIDIAILAGIYSILALGLNVILGNCGLLNLGFAAFYAIGAYSCALLTVKLGLGFWSALPLSLFIAALSGLLLAIPALRLKGDYLAIVTLGFGEIVHLTLNNWDSITNGPNGISGIPVPFLFGYKIMTLSHYYYIVLFFVLLAIVLMNRTYRSRIGRAWLAIREDETAAEAMGIDATKYKFLAFSYGAFWAGLAGVLFASKMRFISPESFTFMESVFIACMVILGGLGSIPGVIIGTLILVVLPEVLREFQLYRMLALGAGLVLMMIFRPQGIVGKRS